jgi:hypothetical protein
MCNIMHIVSGTPQWHKLFTLSSRGAVCGVPPGSRALNANQNQLVHHGLKPVRPNLKTASETGPAAGTK